MSFGNSCNRSTSLHHPGVITKIQPLFVSADVTPLVSSALTVEVDQTPPATTNFPYNREARRQANIRRNEALLLELELKEAAEGLGIPPPPLKGKGKGKGKRPATATPARPVQPKKKPEPKAETPSAPRRQSARLTHRYADPDETPEQREKRIADLEAKRKRDEEERLEALEQERAAKRPRHNDLDLTVLAESEELSNEEIQSLRNTLEVVCREPHPRAVGKDSPSSPPDKEQKDHAIAELRALLSKMVIRSRAKVTQDRVYSMAYHPERTKDLVFVGDKHGQLGIWDALAPLDEPDEDEDTEADASEGGKYWRLQPHWPKTSKSSISCIKFNPVDSHSVLTTAYDCTLRSTSFVSGKSIELFSLASASTLLTSFDLPSNGNEIWISDGLGAVNPRRDHILVTSSNDHTLKLSFQAYIETGSLLEEEGAPGVLEADNQIVDQFLSSRSGQGTILAEYEHGQSASSAYWDPSGTRIVSTSYDNKLRVWNLGSWPSYKNPTVRTDFSPSRQISHNCKSGKWVTVLKAQWSPNPDVTAHFTVGNMNHSLNIFAYTGEEIVRLSDSTKISAVQAVTASHPSIIERAASGNASGRCVLWGPAESD
ncbi:hypothetical protein BS47DRAFT_1387175 [Hydnum rufescens UP504]|uniref:DNA damage-binding protein CMR1 n=1 Tax=Hydnum rufescens UP504 TaxID=1448309 RepID=A0A9P6BA49_9AGAM|nr:hypothetical protein BS47DRAFT_1387175 [Hydnum rufescens UP504]